MILCNISKPCWYSFCGNLWNTNRQAATMSTQLFNGLGGIVQGALYISGGDQILCSSKHLKHICLRVIGGQIRFGQTRRTPSILHSIEATVNTLKDKREGQKKQIKNEDRMWEKFFAPKDLFKDYFGITLKYCFVSFICLYFIWSNEKGWAALQYNVVCYNRPLLVITTVRVGESLFIAAVCVSNIKKKQWT